MRSWVLAVAALVPLTGCGGHPHDDGAVATRFRRTANALCADAAARSERATKPLVVAGRRDEADAAQAAIRRATEAELRRLDPPPALRDDLATLLTLRARGAAEDQAARRALARGDLGGSQVADTAALDAYDRAATVATRLGIPGCL